MTIASPRPPAVGTCVADAMVRRPLLTPAAATVGRARGILRDDHVHAVLLVEGDRLVAVVERDDLAGLADDRPAAPVGRLDGRVVAPDADLAVVHAAMPGRRLAVVDADGRLLGLLCLKRTGAGFCSDADVAARAADPR